MQCHVLFMRLYPAPTSYGCNPSVPMRLYPAYNTIVTRKGLCGCIPHMPQLNGCIPFVVLFMRLYPAPISCGCNPSVPMRLCPAYNTIVTSKGLCGCIPHMPRLNGCIPFFFTQVTTRPTICGYIPHSIPICTSTQPSSTG